MNKKQKDIWKIITLENERSQKCKNENEKLRENLLQVYNMINKSNGPREAPPRQQQHNTQQPPRAELQNQSAPPVNGGSPQLVEDVDGKPYL